MLGEGPAAFAYIPPAHARALADSGFRPFAWAVRACLAAQPLLRHVPLPALTYLAYGVRVVVGGACNSAVVLAQVRSPNSTP